MNREDIRISVIICTHQRSAHLAKALESLVAQEGVCDNVEVVVVDNRSTDDTRTVTERFARNHPVRYLYQQELGLCHARNRGYKESRAPIVAFLDDDAIACPGWLKAIATAFDETGPDVGCIGGRVIPVWEAPCPSWLSHQLSLGLTIVDWSETAHKIEDLRVEWLVGSNLAFRRTALEAVNGFHPSLDRVGSRMLSSGDVFILREAMRRGFSCFYQPAMAVRHRVPASRLTKQWFRNRYYWQGISDAAMFLIEESPSPAGRIKTAVGRMGRLLREPKTLLSLLESTNDAKKFENQCWTWIEIGHVAGLLGAAGR